MSLAIDIDEERNTLLDLLEELGGVSPSRVVRRPAPGTATEADVVRLLASPVKRACELIDGTLVEKAMGLRESFLAMFLGGMLASFVRTKNLGIVSGEQGPLRLFPSNVRIPDVAFISWDRIPNRRLPSEPIPDLAPDLAVEVLSESNTVKEMEIKRDDYFRAGVRLYWEIDPVNRTVTAYTASDNRRVLTVTDLLDGGVVLPGFSIPLTELFGELDRHG